MSLVITISMALIGVDQGPSPDWFREAIDVSTEAARFEPGQRSEFPYRGRAGITIKKRVSAANRTKSSERLNARRIFIYSEYLVGPVQ